MIKLILLNFAMFLIANCYDTSHSPLYKFEKMMKIRENYDRYSICLKNEGSCDTNGMIMKGILYDVLNHNKLEYTNIEKKPVVDTLRYFKKYYKNDYDIIMKIYDKKQQIRI